LRIASIDIGTNTLRILILEYNNAAKPEKLYIGREITRLGEGFTDERKVIGLNAIERALKTLSGFSQTMKDYGVQKMRAVATSAVRESENGRDFVSLVLGETGIPIDIITGDEEARLTVLGVLGNVTFDTPDCLIFDIGGGSTEYVYVKSGKIENIVSTGLGVVSLTENYLKNDTDTQSDINRLKARIEDIINTALAELPQPDPAGLTVIGTAGTPTTLAAIQMGLEKYDPALVNNFILTGHMIKEILGNLLKMTKAERTDVPGLEKGREDLIISGILITLATLGRFSTDRMVVSDAGLLEGIALDLLK
jgi:exopolyphosphatase/guanosine-5'-triphosphate,3'-diphosphate pyrophosphatase